MDHELIKRVEIEKTTTGDEQKRYQLMQKLVSHDPQAFRQIDVDDYDLNITENFEDLQYIDDLITPLIYCAHHGLKEICKHLLRNKKIDLDFETKANLQTPLIIACMRGNYEIARILVLGGAEVNKPNIFNHSPLTVTIFRLAQQPNSFQNNRLCFMLAQFLIHHGADVNWVIDKKKGFSMLHYFCAVKIKLSKIQKQLNFQIIKFLVEKGADISQRTLKDQTVKDLLKTHCNRENILNFLQETESRNLSVNARIPKHNIKKLGEDYFKAAVKKSDKN